MLVDQSGNCKKTEALATSYDYAWDALSSSRDDELEDGVTERRGGSCNRRTGSNV